MPMTFNPNDKGASMSLLNNNMSAKSTVGGWTNTWARGSKFKSIGKLYFEMTVDVGATGGVMIGVGDDTAFFTGGASATANYQVIYNNGVYGKTNATIGNGANTGDTVGVAVDLDARKIQFYKNGVALGTPYDCPTGNITPLVWLYDTTYQITANFGATAFKYPMPTGYKAFDTEMFFLVEDNAKIKTLVDSSWREVSDKTENTFKTKGFTELNPLLNTISKDIKPMVSSGSLGVGVRLGATVDKTKYTITRLGVF